MSDEKKHKREETREERDMKIRRENVFFGTCLLFKRQSNEYKVNDF